MLNLELLRDVCEFNDDVRNEITKGLHYIYSGLEKYSKMMNEDVMGNIEIQDLAKMKQSIDVFQLQLSQMMMSDIDLDHLFMKDFNKIRPVQISVSQKTYEINDWVDALGYVCEALATTDHERFVNYVNEKYINRPSVVFQTESTLYTYKINNTDLNLNLSIPNNKVRVVLANLVESFDLDSTNLAIKIMK